MAAKVVSVGRDAGHAFSKPIGDSIRLLTGLGVEGDAHCGITVKHRSRVAVDPSQPNLRQVHLIHAELFDELKLAGFDLAPGDLGENVTTLGIDLLALPAGARLQLGDKASIEITGLRNPCAQIEAFRPGLLSAVLGRDTEGRLVRKSGVMAIVLAGGEIRPGDAIGLTLPDLPHHALERV
ncbi:MOSC domain containing protein [Bosea sp. LC85]|uniref:MOSC domain-containing protein n=1 Tax=Bosea sp. LC85 TaxID=1502851 RepID=UPI0004E33948|nr:MOSC domain-containing protein [Bosea sp. LC85]KFC63705.1 MOSC domain containing protein [Bosea sp. LC85]